MQTGLPLVRRPYAAVAGELGITEQALLHTLEDLLDRRILTRFGPMFHAGEMGGGLTLAAMRVRSRTLKTPPERLTPSTRWPTITVGNMN